VVPFGYDGSLFLLIIWSQFDFEFSCAVFYIEFLLVVFQVALFANIAHFSVPFFNGFVDAK